MLPTGQRVILVVLVIPVDKHHMKSANGRPNHVAVAFYLHPVVPELLAIYFVPNGTLSQLYVLDREVHRVEQVDVAAYPILLDLESVNVATRIILSIPVG